MIEYDEYGRPIPARDPFLDMMMKPFEQQPDPNTPPVQGSAEMAAPPIPRGRSTNPVLAASGISTEGPLADQAAQNAQNYEPPLYEEQGQIRNMPQVYGQAGDPYNADEGPLTPQETANAMPQTQDAMKKLIDQHMLRGATPSQQQHYDSYVQGSREKRAAEKAFLRQNAPQGGGTGYRGSDGMTMGGEGSGPTVRKIGGYTFVSGRWRPPGADEQAQLDLMKARTTNERMKPALELENISSRRSIAESAMRGRAQEREEDRRFREQENEANRGLRERSLTEAERRNSILEEDRAETRQNRASEAADKQLAKLIPDMESTFGDLTELEQFAGTDDRPWYAHKPAEGQVDPFAVPQRGTPEYEKRADQQAVRDKAGMPTGKRQAIPGSHKALQRKLMNAVDRILDAHPNGEEYIPQQIKDYLEPLYRQRDVEKAIKPYRKPVY